jgi:hypothetical protein
MLNFGPRLRHVLGLLLDLDLRIMLMPRLDMCLRLRPTLILMLSPELRLED